MTFRNARLLYSAAVLTIFIAGCHPFTDDHEPSGPAVSPQRAIPAPVATSPSPASTIKTPTSLQSPRVTRKTIAGILFEGVAFDARSHRLVVADQPGGPGSRFADAAAAAHSRGGLAAFNAGFFTPTGDPLGLVISEGTRAGAWNSASSLGSGAWHTDTAGRMAITRRETLGRSAASTMPELLQAGPMLVRDGHLVSGLEATKPSMRMLLLWDGSSRWWIGQATPCTLAALAIAVSDGQPAGWKPHAALNLDGGRSSELWISAKVTGGPIERSHPWNRQVRNFLVLTQ